MTLTRTILRDAWARFRPLLYEPHPHRFPRSLTYPTVPEWSEFLFWSWAVSTDRSDGYFVREIGSHLILYQKPFNRGLVSPGISSILRSKGKTSNLTIRFLILSFPGSLNAYPTRVNRGSGWMVPAHLSHGTRVQSSTCARTRSALRGGRHEIPAGCRARSQGRGEVVHRTVVTTRRLLVPFPPRG